jgi:hypothetical protein
MSTTLVRRYAGALAVGALTAGLLAGAPAAHAHDADRVPKAIGAGWLQSQLGDGLLHAAYLDSFTDPANPTVVHYVDYGATVEAAFALDAVDRPRVLPRISEALEDSVDSYITGAESGEPGDLYAGPTGKLLAFASELGSDVPHPASFGGTNLIARMEALTADAGLDAGRIADGAADDYANVFGQIWATRGLLNVASAEAPAALDYLLSQQCDDGHFTTYFDTCATDNPGPDATALAVILLSPYAGSHPTLASALGEAVDFLVGFQSGNGSFTDDNGVANANSTGLGGWALGLMDEHEAAEEAAVWLRALQVPGRGCDGKLASQRGAIAYDGAAYQTGRRKGIKPLTAGQWQTVAAQSVPALAWAPATEVKLAVDAPERVDAGSQVRVRVAGLAPGERACVGIGQRLVSVVGPTDGAAVKVKITVAKPLGKRTVKVLTANDSAADRIVAD